MPTLLHLETSAKSCSASWAIDGTCVSDETIISEHFVHAEQLHPLIEKLRTQAGINWSDVDAIAVSKGPGSYTGLRIGVSAAKGLCYATDAQLIALDTTAILAHAAREFAAEADIILPMIDAGRMEVYCGEFDAQGNRLHADRAVILSDEFFHSFQGKQIIICGDGASKCAPWQSPTIRLIHNFPQATMMHVPALEAFHSGAFENVAYFEPFYLKEYVPGISKRSVL